MTCYDHGGVEEDDSSILTASVPAAESANFISPTVHIRTVNTYIYIYRRQWRVLQKIRLSVGIDNIVSGALSRSTFC